MSVASIWTAFLVAQKPGVQAGLDGAGHEQSPGWQ
jgi:hypothetical protein